MDDYDYPDSPDLPFDEYGDQDAISCSNGDYNTWEENQVSLDHDNDYDEGDDLSLDRDDYEYDHDRFDLDY